MRTEGIICSNKHVLQHIQNGFDVITVTNFTHSVHNIIMRMGFMVTHTLPAAYVYGIQNHL